MSPGESAPGSLAPIASRACRLKGLRGSLQGRVVHELFFWNGQVVGDVGEHADVRRTNKKANLLPGNSIERQRAISDGLETEGYGGEVIRRSRVLLKQMITDLDQLLLQLREARQINVVKAEQKIPASAASQNSIDR